MAQAALATASDRSSRLQASRLQARQAAQIESLPAANNNRAFMQAQAAPNNVIDLEGYRRAQLLQNRNPNNSPQEEERASFAEEEEEEELEAEAEMSEQAQVSQFLMQTLMARSASERQLAKERAKQQQIEKVRAEVKKEAKAAIRRGAIWVVDLIAAALDLGSVGVAFLVDVFIYLFTLGWLNVEMIYGTHIAKKKSKFISPISWAPIPMPVDKEAIWLQSFIVAADILVAVVIATFMFFAFCWIHDYIQILTNPFVTAAEGGANLCLGQAILTALGFF